jgi:hypothetical protein
MYACSVKQLADFTFGRKEKMSEWVCQVALKKASGVMAPTIDEDVSNFH